jgi:hypothetical protein
LLSSNTYRGCAIVLAALSAHLYRGISIREIQQMIESLDQSLKASTIMQSQTDLFGGAGLTITNAWTTASNLGFTSEQIIVASDSELIYAAKMFGIARQQEMSGRRLA